MMTEIWAVIGVIYILQIWQAWILWRMNEDLEEFKDISKKNIKDD